MYCPNCGSKIDDQTKFCDICGSKIEEVHIRIPNADQIVEKKEHTYDGRSLVSKLAQTSGGRPMAARIIAAIILIVLLCAGFSKFGDYNYTKPLDEIMHLTERQDTVFSHYMKAAQPTCLADTLKTCNRIMDDKVEGYTAWKANIENEIEDNLTELKSYCGSDLKVRSFIVSEHQMDVSELREAREQLGQLKGKLKLIQKGGAYYGIVSNSLSSSELKKYNKAMDRLASDLSDLNIRDGYILDIYIGAEEETGAWTNYDYGTVSLVNISGKWCISEYDGDFAPLRYAAFY